MRDNVQVSPEDLPLYEYLLAEKKLSKEGALQFIKEYSKLPDKLKSEVIYEAVGKKVYKTMPEDINTFLDDSYFMGGLFTLFPIWRELLNEVYPSPFTKKYNEVILSVATRCFAKGTKVRLSDGTTKPVEELKVGECLLGCDGTKRSIQSITSGLNKIYRITPENGAKPFSCISTHILPLFNVETNSYIDLELAVYLNLPKHERDKYRLYFSGEVQYKKKDLEVDPYLYGFLLNDFSKTGRIEESYLLGSAQQRRKVFAGIIDMEYGEYTIKKDRIFLTPVKEETIEYYEELARSLGFSVEYLDNSTIKVEGNFKKLPTKITKFKYQDSDYSYLSLSKFLVEDIGVGEYYGFTLDKDNKFLLDSYLVAHNSGKTFVSALSILYEIYLLTCMIDPLKLLMSSNIVIALLSQDNSTAVSQLGGEIYRGLTQAQCFKGSIKDKLSFSKLDGDGVKLTDYLLVRAGSMLGTVIGTNLYCGCLDEANMPSPRISAENLVDYRLKIYHEMLDRKTATFKSAPKMSGILWLTSSPTDEGDVIGERIDEVKRAGLTTTLIRDNIARWEARTDIKTKETFQFFLGSDTKDPSIVDEDLILKPEEWERVISVPAEVEFYNEFKLNPYKAIQNIAGRRTMPETALFNTVSVFDKVFYKDNDIFTKDTITISVNRGLNLSDYLIDKDYFSHPHRPDCYRYIHLDMAYSSDKFGIASVYSDRAKYINEEDGHEMMARRYYVDFCLGITSPNKEKVDILKVLDFVYSLKEKGYPLKLVTTDNHQGEIARQYIKKHGVRTDYLSMEKDKEKYLNLKNMILTQTLEGYKNPDLIKDLRGLRESTKKIEKGKGYSDDMSNALGGALWSCSQDRFYKKNNETISSIINQSGNILQGSKQTNAYIATQTTSRNYGIISPNRPRQSNGMGFNYNNFNF